MSDRQSPSVSIVIPCYKQAHLLGEAIESVLAQTYQDFEIIVVDDGSPDDTSEVAARYPDVKCIRQQNQGQHVARNTGARASNGRFLVFLDSDDRLLPRALTVGLEAFDQHPECGFVCGHARFITFDGKPFPYTQRPCINMGYAFLLERNEIVSPMVVMFRREVFESVEGFASFAAGVNIKGAEDYDIYLRIARRFPIRCHHEVIAEYRQHPTSTSQNGELMMKATAAVLRAQHEHVRGDAKLEAAHKLGVRFYREYYGEQMINQVRERVRRGGDWRRALRDAGVLLRHYPRGVAGNLNRKLRATIFGVRG